MLDNILIFSSEQTLPNNTSEASSYANGSTTVDGVIDLGALVNDSGVALKQFGPKNGNIRVKSVIHTVPAGTSLKVTLQDCETVDGVFQATDIASPVITVASGDLAAGKTVLDVALPSRVRQFLRLLYTSVGDQSAGKINSFLEYGSMSEDVTPFRV